MTQTTTSDANLKILLLGGTAEARVLAERLSATPSVAVKAALAGLTRAPQAYPCPMRSGGFGGPEGLAAHLREERFDAVIDATHPFAERISANARAAAKTGLPLLRLERPAWTPEPGEDWISAPTIEAAAEIPPSGARVFLGVGPGAAAKIRKREDVWLALRVVDPPETPFPFAEGRWVVGRPSCDADEEERLLRELRVDWLVLKNSGGSRARLEAARRLGLPIVVVDRPASSESAEPGAATVETIAEAEDWVRGLRQTPPDAARETPAGA